MLHNRRNCTPGLAIERLPSTAASDFPALHPSHENL